VSDKEAAKKRTQMLKALRTERTETVERTQERIKEQKRIRKQLGEAMKDGPKTVPEIADAAGMPSDQVLWHITAMKKYDLVREVGMEGEYYQYELTKETNK
jgi:predicted Rossmann fold nucleotide-binding protein DprA/Smf involved in DNA uptake